ncbi:MAG TPA: FAD-dependent oxidoreductase [Actinoallomurus sp.]|nr:FAD-dependent oxidoreductase [Actinoallomurus sp.]
MSTSRTAGRVDVCIVGAGPAGAVAARRLAASGFGVVVLEQGDGPDYSQARAAEPDFEIDSAPEWGWNPNVRRREQDYPIECSELRPRRARLQRGGRRARSSTPAVAARTPGADGPSRRAGAQPARPALVARVERDRDPPVRCATPTGSLREILRQDGEPTPEQTAFVGEVVAGAYFLDERVKDLIGYHGRRAVPIPPVPDYGDLITPVVERGPIYRATH